jgi:hypothetical protein
MIPNFKSRVNMQLGFIRTTDDLFNGDYVKGLEYYIQFDNKKPRKFDLNKKSMLGAFVYDSPELLEYVKNNTTKINSVEELRKIIKFDI